MSVRILMYHDVIEKGQSPDGSGFPGPAAAEYKLARDRFEQHFNALILTAKSYSIRLDGDLLQSKSDPGFIFTFDDGGISATSIVAPLLRKHRIRGCFFIATDYLDRPGFLRRSDVVRLRDEGHTIGTHSCSHSIPMARLGLKAMIEEWRASRAILSELSQQEITIGSVPGGLYTRSIAEAAATAGLKVLLTSEPTTQVTRIAGCLIKGRYHLTQYSTPKFAAQLARGKISACGRQALAWQVKKLLRALYYFVPDYKQRIPYGK
jgi:peptidoglycan/xylan/chitin deacetylase (PgdA/CDA1 family)